MLCHGLRKVSQTFRCIANGQVAANEKKCAEKAKVQLLFEKFSRLPLFKKYNNI